MLFTDFLIRSLSIILSEFASPPCLFNTLCFNFNNVQWNTPTFVEQNVECFFALFELCAKEYTFGGEAQKRLFFCVAQEFDESLSCDLAE